MPPARTGGLSFHFQCTVDAGAGLHALASTAAMVKAKHVQISPVPHTETEPDDAESSGSRAGSNGTARATILPWLAAQEDPNTADTLDFGATHGLSRGAVYSFLAAAVKEKILKRRKPGQFRLTAEGQRAAQTLSQAATPEGAAAPTPDAAPAAPAVSTEHAQRFAVSHNEFTLQQIKSGNTVYGNIKEAFRKAGRNPKSIDGALGKLRKMKWIAQAGREMGNYKLTAKGTAALQTYGKERTK